MHVVARHLLSYCNARVARGAPVCVQTDYTEKLRKGRMSSVHNLLLGAFSIVYEGDAMVERIE